MADGSVIFSTALDNKQLEKELARAKKEIGKLEQSTSAQEAKKSPLVQQAQELEQNIKAARAEVEKYRADWLSGVAGADKEQSNAIMKTQQLESEHAGVVAQIDKIDAKLQPAYAKLDAMKISAGGIEQELAKASGGAAMMQPALDRAHKGLTRFSMRLREVVRSALIFTLITQALAAMRNWLGKVIKTNSEASAAVARLKGALLTMAQPIIDIIIPAFVTMVNIITRVISTIAQLFAMLTGTTIDHSKSAAEALNNETKAIEGAGAAAKDAGKQLAGFDEINKLSNNASSGAGASGSQGTNPDFNFDAGVGDGQLKNILALVEAIGSSFLAWKIGTALGKNLKEIAGLALAIYSAIQFAKNMFDAWNNGVDLGNVLGMVASAAALATGLYIALGPVAAGISLVVTGIAMLATGFHDAYVNGWNLENLFLSIAGIMAAGIGIGLLLGSWLPALIAGIASIVLAIAVAYGHGEELLAGVKEILQGFLDFFKGVFTGDIDLAIKGVGEIVDGLKGVFSAVLNSIRDMFTSFFDWLDEKTGGKFHGIINTINGFITTVFDTANETLGKVLDAVKTILTGVVEFVSGVFTGDWDAAWNGVKDIFKGVWNGIVSLLEGAVNIIVKGVNWLITQLNKIHFEIPEWVPGVGGKSFGINIPEISEIQIPRLATGAVIPPNREFMAILGDQKSGTNIEAPLETIVQAVMLALQKSGMSGSGGAQIIENILNLDGETIYRNQKKVSRRHGTSLVGV